MKSKRPPIVFIHGAFCGGWSFDAFSKPFADAGYAVHRPTLRYHDCGLRPPQKLARTSLTDYAADLEITITSLGTVPVLIGHSLGGLLAQMLAARGLAKAAILLAPSPPWGLLPSTFFEIGSAQALFLAGDFWNQILLPHYGVVAANSLDKLSRERRDAVYAQLVPESGLATFETLSWALDPRRASHVPANDVACPMFFLSGSEDKINPSSTVRRIAERYRRADYHELAGRIIG